MYFFFCSKYKNGFNKGASDKVFPPVLEMRRRMLLLTQESVMLYTLRVWRIVGRQ